jgi:hypothetical protein
MWTCQCIACSRIDDLGLKFILHAGAFVIQEMAGRQELAGPEVVMAHRLLKSGAGRRQRGRRLSVGGPGK